MLHFVDPHLTWTQTAQVCSVFGRVSVHGYTLRPLTFYTVYNYRTHRPLAMNLLPSTDPLTISPEIHRFLDEYRIDESTLSSLAQQPGDLLLIRRCPADDRSFLRFMQENQIHSRWFSEKYSVFEAEIGWKRIEQDLQIRFTEPNPQSAVLPNKKFIEVADHIIQNWKERATESNDLSSFVLLR